MLAILLPIQHAAVGSVAMISYAFASPVNAAMAHLSSHLVFRTFQTVLGTVSL